MPQEQKAIGEQTSAVGELSHAYSEFADQLGIVNKALEENTNATVTNAVALLDWTAKTVDALGRSMEFEDLQREGTQLFADMQTPLEEHASSLERLSVLYQAGAIDAQTFARANQQLTLGMAQNWLGAAGAVSNALTAIFKDNKAVAIANAVINTAEAITAALKNPPGPPFSYIYAAAAAAAGAAQIATILATEPGSGGKSAAFKSGGTSAATAQAGAAANAAGTQRTAQSVNITIEGDYYTPETMRRILAGLNDVIADGAQLNVSGG